MFIAINTVEGRYAKAFFNSAQSKTKTHLAELTSLQRFLDENSEIRKVILSSILPLNQRQLALKKVMEVLAISADVQSFCLFLIHKKRFSIFSKIVDSYKMLYEFSENIQHVSITSAIELNEDSQESIQNIVKEFFPGHRLDYTYGVNPNILGGVVIRVGNFQIDSSLKTSLISLAQTMKGNE